MDLIDPLFQRVLMRRCKARGLPTSGTKVELLDHLLGSAAVNSLATRAQADAAAAAADDREAFEPLRTNADAAAVAALGSAVSLVSGCDERTRYIVSETWF